MKFNLKGSFVIFCVCLTQYSVCIAQKVKPEQYGIKSKKALQLFLEGKDQANMRDRARAVELYRQAIELEPEFGQAHYELGLNLFLIDEYSQALEHLERAYELDSGKYSGFYLGETYYYLMHYEEATKHLERYVDAGKGNAQLINIAQKHLKSAQFAQEAIKDSLPFKPINLGLSINSPGDDYLPYLTADDTYLLFTSRRNGSTGGFDPMLRDYPEDFYYSIYEDGTWQAAENLGPPINTPRNEGAGAISQDGKIIFYTICDHPEGLGRCDIFYALKSGNTWGEPKNMGPSINSEYWESQPCLSHDGKTLYFVSDRNGGVGGRDIYQSVFSKGKWSKAMNMGKPVNSEGNEGGPFLHADDQTLYFASDGHPGFGGQDLFVSKKQKNGWSEPVNLGYPLNTIGEEANIFVNAKGELGFINSTRAGGIGRSDIYQFTLAPEIRPQVATFLRGITRDSVTQKPLRALIQLVDVESGDTLRTQFSDTQDGSFLMSLPINSQYAAFVEAPGYLFTSKHFYLKGLATDVYFDLIIDMTPIKRGANIVLNNIFFDTGEYELKPTSVTELEKLRQYLERNPKLRIELQGHTDDVGSDEANLTLSQNRAEAVQNYLIEKGIDPERMIAKGYGETKPVAPNDTDENRAINRRTEMKILDF